eukprot:CAMPEP_0172197556 /NCGR_PEP_ID=MMETSP1050-20130122/27537_1 /TAXON_ID=233186 /ORGANISM="Cryptomonas curvata, Strain CCAP979/52" /LENGTH=157 /DNA_ID=CAMNT_0012874159 /DNA_START=82 /DNA_END=555 /DNA_ORIENTATION=+
MSRWRTRQTPEPGTRNNDPFYLAQNDHIFQPDAYRRDSVRHSQRRDQIFGIGMKLPTTDYMLLIRLESHRVICSGHFDQSVSHLNVQLKNYVTNTNIFNFHIGITRSRNDKITVFVSDKGKCWALELPNAQDISNMYNALRVKIESLLNFVLIPAVL